MARAPQGKGDSPGADLSGSIVAGIRPSEAQRRYLERGLTQAGGKLPLFDRNDDAAIATFIVRYLKLDE